MLRARIDLVNGRDPGAEGKTKQLETSGAELGAKRATFQADDQSPRRARRPLQPDRALEGALRSLAIRFPEPLLLRSAASGQDARRPGAHQGVAGGTLQNVVGILNEANKFDNDISMNAEVRTLSDGAPSEVRVVYVGLGQAYFVSAKGEAGIGRPGPDGWHWEIDRSIAPSVAQVVEILQAKSKPKLVPLP